MKAVKPQSRVLILRQKLSEVLVLSSNIMDILEIKLTVCAKLSLKKRFHFIGSALEIENEFIDNVRHKKGFAILILDIKGIKTKQIREIIDILRSLYLRIDIGYMPFVILMSSQKMTKSKTKRY